MISTGLAHCPINSIVYGALKDHEDRFQTTDDEKSVLFKNFCYADQQQSCCFVETVEGV